MLLMIDVGNTNTVLGVSSLSGEDSILATWRVSSNRKRTADEWSALLLPLLGSPGLTGTRIAAVVISSVVPAITNSLLEMCHRHLEVQPLLVSSTLDLGI